MRPRTEPVGPGITSLTATPGPRLPLCEVWWPARRRQCRHGALATSTRCVTPWRGSTPATDSPTAFTHPDFVMANVVAPGDGRMVLVDWSGAGRAPRMWSLGFLLWSVGSGGDLARVDRAVDGYRRRVRPEPEELARLDTLVAARPIVFEAWAFATGRKPLAEAARGLPAIRERAAAIAARARAAFAAA